MRAPLVWALAVLPLALAGWAPGVVADPTPPYFTDVTDETGLTGIGTFRISVGDLNGDGYPDLVLHLEPNHASGDVLDKQLVYLNMPSEDPNPYAREFVDVTAESGIRANREGTPDGRHSDSAVFADVDNDGDLDIFTNVYHHDSWDLDEGHNELLLNDGDAHFTLAPNSPFHLEPTIWNTAAAVFADIDNDGNVDLYIGNWYGPPDRVLTKDRLYLGGGDGSFTDVTDSSGIGAADKKTCVYAVAAFDWNDDGLMDLFAPPYSRTVSGSEARHWRNNGDGTFTNVAADTNYDDYRGYVFPPLYVSFGTMPWDYDNDGDMDFLELITHGTGDGSDGVHSTSVTNVAGVFSWDFDRVDGRATEDPDTSHHGDHFGSWLDFDGDGLVDFVLTESGYENNRIYLFKQAPNNTFSPVTPDSGFDSINTENLPPGNATPLDYDLDGDEDLIIGLGTNHGLRLYRNNVGTDNNWITIRLVGGGGPGQANRSAIGAQVQVTAGATTWTREVAAGNGHQLPARPLALTFGLGQAESIDTIRVRWPNETLSITELTDVSVNQFLTISEACDAPLDPTGLAVTKQAPDLLLTWDDPEDPELTWNVYRDADPNPALWGAPHASGVSDEDPLTPGIQHTDSGAASDGATWFYLVTAVNACGETPLR